MEAAGGYVYLSYNVDAEEERQEALRLAINCTILAPAGTVEQYTSVLCAASKIR